MSAESSFNYCMSLILDSHIHSVMSISLATPKALISKKRGIGFLRQGILAYSLGIYLSIRRTTLHIWGIDPGIGLTDFISATRGSISVLVLNIKNSLKANLSWACISFSDPLTMKYPPWLYIHSSIFIFYSGVVASFNLHHFEPTITGRYPRKTFGMFYH